MVEEDEIDLRPYFETLLRRWRLILGLTLAAALSAAAYSLLAPRSYEATALVAIANFGSKPSPDAKAYVELATSDTVLAELLRSPAASGSGMDLQGLKDEVRARRLEASTGADPSLVYLRVRQTDRELASGLAAGWSAAFVRVANATFNLVKDTTEFDVQLNAAREELKQAERDLVLAESRNSVEIIQTELKALRDVLEALYASRVPLETALQEAKSLQAQLRQYAPATRGSAADDLAIMTIQASALGKPVQLQLESIQGTSDRTVGAHLLSLDNLVGMITDRSREVERQIAAIQPRILELQEELQQAQSERTPLIARRDSAREAVKQLDAAKIAATVARVSREAGVGQARALGEGAVHVEDAPRNTGRNAALAGILGLMLGVAAAFGMERMGARRGAMALGTAPARR